MQVNNRGAFRHVTPELASSGLAVVPPQSVFGFDADSFYGSYSDFKQRIEIGRKNTSAAPHDRNLVVN
jgi:hypothetical protein